ncbi:MAG: hypothetical protein K5663_03825 [Clostridiales bacterium]|nr:hypothetical protein [Clostridiales bacterium]
MSLFRSIYKDDKYFGRVERFIKRTKNQKKLARLAREAPLILTREKALERISDPDICKALVDDFVAHPRRVEIVEHSNLIDLVGKVTDQEWLKQLFLNKKAESIFRNAALRQIEDNELLLQVAEEYEDNYFMNTVINKIDLQRVPESQALAWVLRPDKDPKPYYLDRQWRHEIVKQYPFSQEALEKIRDACTDDIMMYSIKLKLLEKDKPQEYWRMLAKPGGTLPSYNGQNFEKSKAMYRGNIPRRKDAVEHLLPIEENQEFLEKLATNHILEAPEILPLVIARLTHKEFVRGKTTLRIAYSNPYAVATVENMFKRRLEELEGK